MDTTRKYDILNGADDNLATVDAPNAQAAVGIWRTQLWDRNPNARGVHAVRIGRTRAAKARKVTSREYLSQYLTTVPADSVMGRLVSEILERGEITSQDVRGMWSAAALLDMDLRGPRHGLRSFARALRAWEARIVK